MSRVIFFSIQNRTVDSDFQKEFPNVRVIFQEYSNFRYDIKYGQRYRELFSRSKLKPMFYLWSWYHLRSPFNNIERICIIQTMITCGDLMRIGKLFKGERASLGLTITRSQIFITLIQEVLGIFQITFYLVYWILK